VNKIIFGYVWRRSEDPSQLSILNLEHSFNGAVLTDGTGGYFGQDGKALIKDWRERPDVISFTKCHISHNGCTVHLLRKIKKGWGGTWEDHLHERGFIVMWVEEEDGSPFERTVEAMKSEHFRAAFN
jgi:hypothetical protein